MSESDPGALLPRRREPHLHGRQAADHRQCGRLGGCGVVREARAAAYDERGAGAGGGGVSRAAALSVWLLFSLGGCSSAKPLPLLSVSNPAANAQIIADVADRLCLRAITNADDFADAVRQTGWPHRKTQFADRKNPLAVWQLPHATLIYSERPFASSDSDGWICTFVTDRAASPPENVLSKILVDQLIDGADLSKSPLGWHWKPSLLTEADMDVTKGETGGLGVTIAYSQLKPLRTLFGK